MNGKHQQNVPIEPIGWSIKLSFGASRSEVTGIDIRFTMDTSGEVEMGITIRLKGNRSKNQLINKFWQLKFSQLEDCKITTDVNAVEITGALTPVRLGASLPTMLTTMRLSAGKLTMRNRKLAAEIINLEKKGEGFLSPSECAFVMHQWRLARAADWAEAATKHMIETTQFGRPKSGCTVTETRISVKKPSTRSP